MQLLRGSGLFLLLAPLVLLLELLNAPRGIDELHLAGEERMAGRADLDPEVLLRGPRRERAPARADDVDLVILGMDAFFQGALQSLLKLDASL